MTKKERVLRAIEFRRPDRVPFCCFAPGVSDLFFMTIAQPDGWQPDEGFYPHVYPIVYYLNSWRFRKFVPPDVQSPKYKRQDEFGCIWETTVKNSIGEVTGHPIDDWEKLDGYVMPDPFAHGRLDRFDLYRKMLAGDSFVVGNLDNGLWERAHFLRGFQALLMDTVTAPGKIELLLDRLLDEWLIPLVGLYASRGAHGVIMTDDWGTQKSLMINPRTWRDIFKPRYARLFEETHRHGMKFFLHSCGWITDIIPDFIEIGLDVIQKDDINFMGLEEIATLASGKICFMGPLDMQRTFPGADTGKIFRETKKTLRAMAIHDGGWIGMYYGVPEAVGLTWKQMLTYHAAVIKYGKYPVR
ncbi:MAG TPA: uroporphyrinogen decarboxylase family protein [bacterium]|nr:uroporphyrinogen decarboxylase family protein [bacterium]